MVNRAAVEPFWTRPDNRIICGVWHGRFMLAHRLWAFEPQVPKAKFLISRSREGGIVAHAARTVGSEVVRGSAAKRGQQKGGVGATFEMVRHMEGGGMMAMTPDGPRGPRMRAKMGPIQIARMAQAPMLGFGWSTRWRIALNSWDRFILPLPFGPGVLVWSDPIPAPAPDASDEEMEATRLRFEQELNRISAEADRLAGVPVTEPAPLPEKCVHEPASAA
jgi:lysophospholipid acyltransferase (LPLAT)-like uncharacterized protein